MGARPLWSGTISFGLVSVPVNLFPALRRERRPLRMMTREGVPLERRFACPREEREVAADEIVRGYETAKGRYVVVTDEELDKLAPRRSRDIDLRRFVDRKKLDPAYFERPYFLAPAPGSTKAYRLLAEAMERTNRAGIATFVMRGKEYLVAILADDGILRAETLRFADEVRTPRMVGLATKGKPAPREVAAFAREIAKLAKPSLSKAELEDPAVRAIEDLVAKKRKKGIKVVRASKEAELPEPIDLVEILRKRMAGAGHRRRA